MKNLLILALAFLTLSACAQNRETKSPMQQTQQSTDEAEILALTRRFTQLMIDRNTAELNKILDKDFTLTHITGYLQPKEEWFREIQTESMKYYSAKEVDYKLTINGDTAVFVQRNVLDARIWGSRNNWRLQQTMTLEKRNGNWIILKSVALTF